MCMLKYEILGLTDKYGMNDVSGGLSTIRDTVIISGIFSILESGTKGRAPKGRGSRVGAGGGFPSRWEWGLEMQPPPEIFSIF